MFEPSRILLLLQFETTLGFLLMLLILLKLLLLLLGDAPELGELFLNSRHVDCWVWPNAVVDVDCQKVYWLMLADWLLFRALELAVVRGGWECRIFAVARSGWAS